MFPERPPSESQVESARRKIVSESRKLESEGAFKLMDYEKIDSMTGGGGGANSASLAGGGGPVGSALADAGAPSVDSFQMELPPTGLLGERFEEHIKKELGLK